MRVAIIGSGIAGNVAAHHLHREHDITVFEAGDLRIDLVKREVLCRGEEVHLTPTEYKLLSALVRCEGKVVTHRQLLVEVWGANYADQTHYLRVYMAQLRQKLERDPARPRQLTTEPGVGYRLTDRSS